ncbi:S-layer homology domain-containing protein [Candidatus Peregrinibacteria bacterium]|nr:S-layer homology domain-containing protein [Candidatus Peregrinibacteria bacterium]
MKTKKLIVSIIAGLTFMFTSILPAQALILIPFEPLIPAIPLVFNPIYVNCSGGNDTNDGTTAAQAVKTITKAISLANAGSETTYQVLISEGTCQNETFPLSVTSRNLYFYGGYYNNFASRDPENHLTQIRGSANTTFDVLNRSFTLSGLKIHSQTSGDAVIYLDLTGVDDHTVIIEGVEIADTVSTLAAIYGNFESGDAVHVNGNYLNNNDSVGATIFVEGTPSTSKIYNNFLYDNMGGFQGGINAQNSLVYNNIISKIEFGSGLYLKSGTKAYNNTVVNNKNGITVASGATGVIIKNNLIAYNSGKELDVGTTTAEYDFNAYFSNTTTHTQAVNELSCDPKLNNVNSTNTGDYKLGANSTCIDEGTELAEVLKDYFGSARKKDGNNDAVYASDPGAHEADGDTAAAPVVSANTASPNIFSPNDDGNNDTTTISFNLNVRSNVIVAIYDGSDIVKQLINEVKSSGTHNVVWDGKNTGGETMPVKTYTYKITAQNSEGMNEKSGNVSIEYGVSGNLCAGFTDVAFNDPLCPAITYVKNEGIFEGYPDGTFQPYTIINRAETTKVATEAFNYTILPDNGTNLGFPDITIGAWYVPYVRTAKDAGIVVGYADGLFRPGQQVNRVEMLKIVLVASGEDLSGVTVTTMPYPDTPLDAWYIIYVQFSKNNALVDASADGKFYPDQGMKRGDVAELFYRFHNGGFM